MPRRRKTVKTRAPVAASQQEQTLMQPFESVNYTQTPSFMNFVTFGFFGDLDDPFLYTSDDYDSYQPSFAVNSLQPHPRIRELAAQEALKNAQELMEEEIKLRTKAEKNKRKKLRKKEKRIEKQNAVKALLCDEEGSSEKNDKMNRTESDGERNGPVESAQTPTPSEPAEDEERSEADLEEEKSVTTAEEEEEEEEMEMKNPGDPAAQECEKRSRELAGIGYRLAASGQYDTAVKYFTEAIKYNPKQFKLFGNRSLCYERMRQYEDAFRDADVALSLSPKWIKGLFRKGKALCGLKRYYEASLVYREVLDLDRSSVEAKKELKQALTLHLMEMGFSWEESSKALKTHRTMEEAIESLFNAAGDAGTENAEQAAVQEEDGDSEKEEWITQRSSRHRGQRAGEPVNLSRLPSLSAPRSGNAVKPKLFPVWVAGLAPSVTYATLQQLFSRAGTVSSIKMLLEQQCAVVTYTKEDDCDRAIQGLNGMVVGGAPLTVQYASPRLCTDPCRSRECFFWRTVGCKRSDCSFKHDPNHKGIDRDKFTGGLGNFHT